VKWDEEEAVDANRIQGGTTTFSKPSNMRVSRFQNIKYRESAGYALEPTLDIPKV
jgi:hypothetical protein